MEQLRKQLWIKYGIWVIRVSFEICFVFGLLVWWVPFLSDWSTCQLSEKAVCGNGIKTRMLDCVRSDGKSVDLKYCEEVGEYCYIFASKFIPNNFNPCCAKWPVLCAAHSQMFFCTIRRLFNIFLKRDCVQCYRFPHIISCILFCLEPKGMLISLFWKKYLGNNK